MASLPGRTGASRRQRRRPQQHSIPWQQQAPTQQLQHAQAWEVHQNHQQQLFQQQGSVEWPSCGYPYQQDCVPVLGFWVALPAGCEAMKCWSSNGEESTIDDFHSKECSSSSNMEVEHSDSDSLRFPPTPDMSPCGSPRQSGAAAVGNESCGFWLESEPFVYEISPVGAPLDAVYDSEFLRGKVSDYCETPPRQAKPRALGSSAPEGVFTPAEAECELMLSKLNAGDEAMVCEVMQWVVEHAWALAISPVGCRVVQQALSSADSSDQITIAEQLKGHVQEASMSPHANHVLQKCIELLPPEKLQFVLDEIKGGAIAIGRHRFGCRILERVVEKCPLSQTEGLLDEVLVAVSQLCRHTFGNFVVQHMLQHGSDAQRHAVVHMLLEDIQRLSRHRVASHVVRTALANCSAEDRQLLVDAIKADADELADLAHHHCGSFVVREMRRGLRR